MMPFLVELKIELNLLKLDCRTTFIDFRGGKGGASLLCSIVGLCLPHRPMSFSYFSFEMLNEMKEKRLK